MAHPRHDRDAVLFDEAAVLAKAMAGDERAMETLLSAYRPFMMNVVRRYSGYWSEDVVQATMLHVVRKLPDFEGRSSFQTWVFSIARNMAINHYWWENRRGVGRTDPLSGYDGVDVDLADPRDYIAHHIEAPELLRVALGAVDTLSPVLRETFRLYLRGFDYIQIAEVCGIGVGTVKSRLSRARDGIRLRMVDRAPELDDLLPRNPGSRVAA